MTSAYLSTPTLSPGTVATASAVVKCTRGGTGRPRNTGDLEKNSENSKQFYVHACAAKRTGHNHTEATYLNPPLKTEPSSGCKRKHHMVH